jgi:hypothetical protein
MKAGSAIAKARVPPDSGPWDTAVVAVESLLDEVEVLVAAEGAVVPEVSAAAEESEQPATPRAAHARINTAISIRKRP